MLKHTAESGQQLSERLSDCIPGALRIQRCSNWGISHSALGEVGRSGGGGGCRDRLAESPVSL